MVKLAEGAFNAYRERKHGLDNHGDPIPDWLYLSERSREAWIAAATSVHDEMIKLVPGSQRKTGLNIQINEYPRQF
jgi:hypothetical protein